MSMFYIVKSNIGKYFPSFLPASSSFSSLSTFRSLNCDSIDCSQAMITIYKVSELM